MISRICICCGEPFFEKEFAGTYNPNICRACSQMADDTDLPVEREHSRAVAPQGIATEWLGDPGKGPAGPRWFEAEL